jgi:hypothetical protein
MDPEVESAWQERNNGLLAFIDKEADRYRDLSEYSRIYYRTLDLVSIVCSVLAPVAVVSSANGLTAFGIGDQYVRGIAVILTILIGLTESIRRTFRHEQRWARAMVTLVTLKKDKQLYIDAQIGKSIGSEEWIQNYKSLYQSVDMATHTEMTAFFEAVFEAEKDRKK